MAPSDNPGKDLAAKAEASVKDTGAKAEDTASKAKAEADKAGSKAQTKAKKTKKGGLSEDDKKKLKIAGAAIAVVAAIALGASKARGGKKEEAKDAKNDVKRHLNWFGQKVEDGATKAKDAGADAADKISAEASKAAEATKKGVSKATAPLDKAGVKLEEKGLKAHQKSDRAVREAYFGAKGETYKPIDVRTGKTGKNDGGFLGGIGNWFADRKDDVGDAANKLRGK